MLQCHCALIDRKNPQNQASLISFLLGVITVVLMSAVLEPSPARSAVLTYTDRAAWENALQNVTTSNLENEPLVSHGTPYTGVDGWLISGPVAPMIVEPQLGTAANGLPLLTQFFYLASASDAGIPPNARLVFPGGVTHQGFGFDYKALGSGWTVQANGVPLHTFAADETGFLGFITTSATFVDFSLVGVGSASIGFAIDNLTVGGELGCTAALPPQDRNVGFGTRGFWFEAPGTFDIAAVKAPADLAVNPQSVEIVRLEGDPSEYLYPAINGTNFTNLFYAQMEPGGQYIVLNPPLRIHAGERIGILGGTTGNGVTTRSSYSANLSGPFLSDIGGYPTRFYRFATDQSVTEGPITSVFYSPYGELGRFEMVIKDCTIAASCDCTPSWAVRTPRGPQPRRNAAMAYDSNRNVTVLFGGADKLGTRFNDTWEFDGTQWTQKLPVTSPSPRSSAGIAFDSGRNVIVLYGGSNGSYIDETWEWDGTDWLQKSATQGVGHYSMAMAYDPILQRVVSQGGNGPGGRDRATFEYDGNAWTISILASPPGFRSRHSMAYDPLLQKLVMYGGQAPGSSILSDTWTYDGSWQSVSASGPGPRLDHHLAGDPLCGGVYLYGGSADNATGLEGLWKFDGGIWSQVTSATKASPGLLRFESLSFDIADEGLILFGGVRDLGSGPIMLSFTWHFACGQDLKYVDHSSGFEHFFAGDAVGFAFSDSLGKTHLTVDNIGSSGEDGVLIGYGEAKGLSTTFVPPIPVLNDTTMTLAFDEHWYPNTSNDIEDEQFIALTGEGGFSGSRFTADFSSLGATGYTVQAFLDTNVVFVQSGISNGTSNLGFPAAIHEMRSGIDPTGSAYFEITKEDTSQTVLADIGGTAVEATRIRFVAENATVPITNFTGTGFVGANLPDMVIDSESVPGPGGMDMTGSSALSALRGEQSGGDLRLTFAPADGVADEGVISTWGRKRDCETAISFDWSALEGGAPPATGSILRFTATGDVGIATDQDLGELRVVVTNPTAGALGLDFTPDYSPLGSTSYTVRFLDAGAIVAEFPAMSGSFPIVAPVLPDGAGQRRVPEAGVASAGFRVHWAASQSLSFGAAKVAVPIVADEIAIIAEAPSETVTRLKSFGIFADGYSEMALVSSQSIPTAVDDELPSHLVVQRVYPNPFNPRVVVSFTTGRREAMRVDIYDVAGRRIRGLLNEELPAGPHKLIWNGTDGHGSQVSSGVYIFRIQSRSESVSMKATLLR